MHWMEVIMKLEDYILSYNSGSQTFDEDSWTMLIEWGIEWTLNQSYEFKVMNSSSTPRSKTKDKHCWYFVPYAFNSKTQVGD
jgi:hypothetical protein